MLLGLGNTPDKRLTERLLMANTDSPPFGKFTLKGLVLSKARKLPIQGSYFCMN